MSGPEALVRHLVGDVLLLLRVDVENRRRQPIGVPHLHQHVVDLDDRAAARGGEERAGPRRSGGQRLDERSRSPGLKPTVSSPSKASVGLRELSAVMAVAACWPVVSGALKAALLIVVIACSVSEPAAPDVPGVGDRAVDDRARCEQRLAERHRLRRVGAAHRGAAVQRVGVAVVAGDRLGGRDAAGRLELR